MVDPRCLVVVAAALAAAACSAPRDASAPQTSVRESMSLQFSVDGRSSDAPSVAALGKTVAVVWTARTPETADIYASVSTDGGATFAAPVRVNDRAGDARASGEQAARVVVGQGHVIHVTWPSRREGRAEIRYAASGDRGKSFSKAITVAGERERGLRGWQSVAVGYDGGVHAVWLDGRHAESGEAGARHQHAMRQDIFHAAWKGSGTPAENTVATNVCFCCKTAIVTSGERVYAVFRHIYPGSLRDIAIARSLDNGATFESPVRLSDDGWKIDACPDDGPAMAVDSHGGLHVTWPTLVPGEPARKGIFYSELPDAATAALAFTPRVRLDAGDADASHPQIASDEHGASAVVWDERAGDRRRIVLRRVVSGTPQPAEIFEGTGAAYPAIAASEAHWVVVWSSQAASGGTALEGRRLPFSSPTSHSTN